MNSKKLNYIVDDLIYGYSQYDFLLSDDNNIGYNGSNLTIVILTYNRAQATLKLLKSIEKNIDNYAGKILIADNGSDKKELDKIYEYAKKSNLDIRVEEFDKNYGVAGGRNRAFSLVETDWILSLDNDIYFINNPLNEIQHTLSLLGTKFLNMPLLSEDKKTIFSNGGVLFTEYNINGSVVGGGSLFAQCSLDEVNDLKPSLSTFLLGGASILNKHEFLRCGKFDENMFIGFEDIDFSITLFNLGLKIGNCPTLSLVHDHTIKTDKKSLEYEKMRFSHGIIKESALYLEKKRGLKIWNANTEMWIKQRQRDLGIFVEENTISKNKTKKKRIALVVDVKGWCFWNIASIIKEKLSKEYDFEIINMEELDNNMAKLFLYTKDSFDLIHIFWRGHLTLLPFYENYIQECGLTYNSFLDLYVYSQNITTSVYDHLFLDDIDKINDIFKKVKSYTVSSKILNDIYSTNNKILKKPLCVITDGVDLNLFKPKNLDRFKKTEKIVVGWVGNSAWSKDIEDFKGFNTIIKPVLTELKEEGYSIEFEFADKQEKMILHEEMPNYYAKINLLVCASKCEGTPNPVLEAMACGVPIITTNVGIVKEAFGKKQSDYILDERSKKALKEKIISVINNKDILKDLSDENLKQIKKWDWSFKCADFKKFFDICIGDNDEK